MSRSPEPAPRAAPPEDPAPAPKGPPQPIDLRATDPCTLVVCLEPSREVAEALFAFARNLHDALGDDAGRVRWFHPSVSLARLVTFPNLDRIHVDRVREAFETAAASREGWEVAYRGVYLTPPEGEAAGRLALGVEADLGFVDAALGRLREAHPGVADTAERPPATRIPLAVIPLEDASGGTRVADPDRLVGQEYVSDVVIGHVVIRPGVGTPVFKRLTSFTLSRR